MPTSAELFDLASRSHQGGDLGRAEILYRQVLQADPAHVETLHRLGILLFGLGQPANAAGCFRQALQVNSLDANASSNLGKVLAAQGQFADAVECYRQALRINPDNPDMLINLGGALKALGQLVEAEECYRKALRLNPHHADAHHNLGNLLVSQGLPAQGIECFRQALRINPGYLNAYINLGNALKEQGQGAEAALCYQHALRLNPNHANAHNNLGNIFFEQDRLAEAIGCFRQALLIAPNYANAHYNLGNVLFVTGEMGEADECFRQASIRDSTHKMARWNRSLLRLLHGDYEAGWPDYELREFQPGLVPRSFEQPRWKGERLDGKSILLYAEQGLGDTIQFIRYAPLVKERGGKVLVECQPALQGLLQGIPGIDQLVSASRLTDGGSATFPYFDVRIPLMSLAGIFKTTLATVPADVPYLRAEPALIEKWRREIARLPASATGSLSVRENPQESPLASTGGQVLPAPTHEVRVGIVWQGNPTQGDDRHRSVPLAQFAPLAKVPGVRLLSLQVGPGQQQLAHAPFPIIDLGRLFNPQSLDDLAAVLPSLDLVVTVCTSVAHLGGALGVPVWVALKYVPHWVWLRDRSDSPWYPSLRLFRQKNPGDWNKVFQQIADEIECRTNGGSHANTTEPPCQFPLVS